MISSRKAQAVTVLAFSSSLPKANFERAVDSTVHREFALLRMDLGDGDVEGADWVAFERLPWLRLVLQVRQPGDAVSLEHTVKRGARQVLDGRLERIKTIIEWQQRGLCGKATQAASCSADSTSERASCAPIGMSSTNLRLHLIRRLDELMADDLPDQRQNAAPASGSAR